MSLVEYATVGLKTDELVRELSEAFSAFDGKGPQQWQAYTYEACRYIIAHDIILEAAKKDGRQMSRPALKLVPGTPARAAHGNIPATT
jgi:hypothetical protein